MLSAYLFAGKYKERERARKPDVTRGFMRYLKFNSGDMNTIFESSAWKLNGQMAANGASVL